MLIQKTTIDANGRIPIPVKLRNLLEVKSGDEVILKYHNNEIIITSYKNSLEAIRSKVRKYTNRSLLEGLEEIRSQDRNHE
jgi:AbrB family looped-hinge helix DNA binding protein